jgi:hypothetical protein
MRLFTPIHIIWICIIFRLTTSFCGFNRFRSLMNITKRPFTRTNTNTTKTPDVFSVEEILHRSYVHM